MITQETFYGVRCDRCGRDHELEGYTYYGDQGEMLSDAKEHGWVELHGRHYCPNCYVLKDGTMRTDMNEDIYVNGEDDRNTDEDNDVYVPRPEWPHCIMKVYRFLKGIDASVMHPEEKDGWVVVKISLGWNGVLSDLTRQMIERICGTKEHRIDIANSERGGRMNYVYVWFKLTEFRCGDRVLVKTKLDNDDTCGKQGVVMALSDSGLRMVGVQFRDKTDLRWMTIDDLEIVKEE